MIPNQKKVTFNSFNDGILHFGDYIEGYDELGDATEKEFVSQGRLFFAFSSIREEDAMKYDSAKKVVLKIKTPYLSVLNSNHVIKYNDQYYQLTHIDSAINRQSLFLYLSSYMDTLRYQVEILDEVKASPLKSPELVHFRTLWCDVISHKTTSVSEANQERFSTKKIFVIRYLSELDPTIQSISQKFLKYSGQIYRILSVSNQNEANQLLEIEVEVI